MGQVLNLILILVLVCFLVGSVILVVAAAMDNEKLATPGWYLITPLFVVGDLILFGMVCAEMFSILP